MHCRRTDVVRTVGHGRLVFIIRSQHSQIKMEKAESNESDKFVVYSWWIFSFCKHQGRFMIPWGHEARHSSFQFGQGNYTPRRLLEHGSLKFLLVAARIMRSCKHIIHVDNRTKMKEEKQAKNNQTIFYQEIMSY